MLKGKTIIELTDVNTGEKEVIEENNMVTNAINDLFNTFPNLINPQAIYKGGNFYDSSHFLRLYEFLLGGILLFDSQIEEKPENTYAPASANLVGCGVYAHQNSTANRKRGNYNQSESEFNDEQRYMKFVYDFSTSEANGTIASVCLTSYMGGCTSYGGKEAEKIKKASNGNIDYTYNFGIRPFFYKGNSNTGSDYSISGSDFYKKYYLMKYHCLSRDFAFDGNYKQAIADKEYSVLVGAGCFNQSSTYSLNNIYYGEYPIFVDVDEDAVYYLKTKNFKNFWIVKRQAYLKSVSILDCPEFKGNLIEEYELPETADMYKYYQGRYYCFDTATKCLYIFYNTYQRTSYYYIANNEIIKTVKIDLSNMSNITLQEFDITNLTGISLDFGYYKRPFVNNGFLYLGNYTQSSTTKPRYFKIEIANPANVSEILYDYTESSYIADDYPVYELNGIIYTQRGNIIKNDEVLKTEFNCFNNFSDGDSYNYHDSFYVPFLINNKLSQFIYCNAIDHAKPNYSVDKNNLSLLYSCNGIMYLNNYLATINNLAEPVTKTADKTMKVTYIIQETESEENTNTET